MLFRILDCHKELAKNIPDIFIKHSFSKYVWNKETVGEYMINSIIQAEKLFNLLLDYEGKTKF